MGTFESSRDITIAAPRTVVYDLVDDFRQWESWSPWEDLDPAMSHEYSGPDCAVGDGTRATWTMTGQQNILMKVLFAVMRMDDRLGKDFEKGLRQLKARAEG